MTSSNIAAVFNKPRLAVAAINRVGQERSDAVGLLMSDNEATKHFPLAYGRQHREHPPVLGNLPATQLLTSLEPTAPLGTRGSGFVAAGPLLRAMRAAGIGGGNGFLRALEMLGATQAQAREVSQHLRRGGVLVSCALDERGLDERDSVANAPLLEGSIMQLELRAPLPGTELVWPDHEPAPSARLFANEIERRSA